MNKQSQKRIVQINHALSGIFGEDMKVIAFKISESRKEILKKLDRKKKLSSIIHDQLYGYLQKFPEEKLGLNQEFVKKKKARLSQFEERALYRGPAITEPPAEYLGGCWRQIKNLGVFKYNISEMEDENDEKQ